MTRYSLRWLWAFFLISSVAYGRRAPVGVENLSHLPLSFEQHDKSFVAHAARYEVVLHDAQAKVGAAGSKTFSLEFTGARAVEGIAEKQLPGKVNYIVGNDPSRWKTGIATYERVRYADVYSGIDLVYYGNQQQLEFDLVVRPGADPSKIRMKVAGASGLSIDPGGALRLEGLKGASIALPKIYQTSKDGERRIDGHFVGEGKDRVRFEVGPYDRSKPLVIDPTIVYSALFTASNFGMARDSAGNIILAGSSQGSDFPLVNPADSLWTPQTGS